MDGWMDKCMDDRWMNDKWVDERMDIDKCTHGQTNDEGDDDAE